MQHQHAPAVVARAAHLHRSGGDVERTFLVPARDFSHRAGLHVQMRVGSPGKEQV